MDLSDKYVRELVKINPMLNDFTKIDDLEYLRSKPVNTFTSEYSIKESDLSRKYIKFLDTKKELTPSEELLKIDLKQLYSGNFPEQYFPITPLNNYYGEKISEITGTGNFYEFSDKDSYLDYIKRLYFIPKITDIFIKNMKLGIKNNMVYPKRIVLQLILQIKEALDNNTKSNNYNHKHKIPKNVKKKFLIAIEKYLINSMKLFSIFLIENYLPKSRDTIGLKYLTGGTKHYDILVKDYTLKSFNAEIVHKIGVKQTEYYLNKLLELKNKNNSHLNLNEYFNIVKSHGESKFKNKNELFDYLKILQRRIYDETFMRFFDDKIEESEMYLIKSIPNVNKSMSAYYQLPDLDNDTKGTFYFNTKDLEKINKDELLVLSAHEGNPGHHYEYLYHSRNNKSLYKRFTTYSPYSEGWALYCESLAKPNNDYELFWIIIYSLHRAIRLVVDTGIHSYGWSYEESFYYMKSRLPFSNQMIKDEIYRYIDDPGQALGYTIGAICIYHLRDLYMKKYNDIKSFHKLILDIGPCHLDILVEEFVKLTQ